MRAKPRPISRTFVALTAAALVAISACSDQAPTTPIRPSRSESTTTTVALLQRTAPLAQQLADSALIGPEGGMLHIREAGIKVHVPNGAVSEPTLFVVTALAGSAVAYDFAPHGAVFAAPLTIEQKFKDIGRLGLDGNTLEAAHFASVADVNTALGLATVNEFLPVNIDLSTNKIRFDVRHFSGYLLASGRVQNQGVRAAPDDAQW